MMSVANNLQSKRRCIAAYTTGHSLYIHICCIGHSLVVYAVSVTAQSLMLCQSQFRGICCVSHSLEVYAVLAYIIQYDSTV